LQKKSLLYWLIRSLAFSNCWVKGCSNKLADPVDYVALGVLPQAK
jgi:hypothetical protein